MKCYLIWELTLSFGDLASVIVQCGHLLARIVEVESICGTVTSVLRVFLLPVAVLGTSWLKICWLLARQIISENAAATAGSGVFFWYTT